VNCVRFCFWRCLWLVYEISREPLNGFAPNSHGRHRLFGASLGRVWRSSAISVACLRFMFRKTSLLYSWYLRWYAVDWFGYDIWWVGFGRVAKKSWPVSISVSYLKVTSTTTWFQARVDFHTVDAWSTISLSTATESPRNAYVHNIHQQAVNVHHSISVFVLHGRSIYSYSHFVLHAKTVLRAGFTSVQIVRPNRNPTNLGVQAFWKAIFLFFQTFSLHYCSSLYILKQWKVAENGSKGQAPDPLIYVSNRSPHL